MEMNVAYQQHKDVLLEDMDGEILLYHPAKALTLHLNGPSAVVWHLCDGNRTVADIVDLVKEAYPQQASQIETDVINVLEDFLAQQVVSAA